MSMCANIKFESNINAEAIIDGDILIVDDVRANLEMLVDILDNAGFKVRPASNGELALRSLQAKLPALILLDVKLSGMDGYEVCRRLKADERTNSIPIIFMNVRDEEASIIKGFQAGGVDFITKPFHPEEVLARVKTHFDLRLMQLNLEIHNASLLNEITERTQAEKLLLESEEKFRAIFENNSAAIAIIDLDTTISMVNDAYCIMSGYSPEEVVGMSWTKQIPPGDLERLKEYNRLRLSNPDAAPDKYEFRFYKKDGEIRYGMMSVTMIKGMSKIITSFLDITERKMAEENLRLSEKKHRLLFETMLQGAVYQAKDGTIISANKSAERILGLTIDQMLGRTSIDQRWKAIHEDGTDFPGNTHPSMVALKTGEDIQNVTMGIYHPQDDSYRWISICAVPQFKDGESEPYQVYTTFDDITDRRRAEEELHASELRYHSLFENMVEGFAYCRMIYDEESPVDFIYLEVNNAFESLTGLKDVTGKRVTEVIPGINHTDTELFQIYGRVALTGKPERFEMFVESLSDWYSISVYSPQNEYFVAVFDVITSRKKSEEELRNTKDYLENLFNYANAPIIVWDSKFRITQFNKAFERLSGLKAVDVIGKEVDILFPHNSREKSLEYIKKTSTGDRWEVVEIDIQHVDGGVSTLLWNSATIFSVDGKTVMATIAQGHDITVRKQTEEALRESEDKFRTLITQMQLGLAVHEIILDESGNPVDYRFVDINPSFERLTGLKREICLGKTVLEVMPLTENYWIEKYGHVALTGEPLFFENQSIELGKYFSVVAYRPRKNEFAVIVEDITERRRAEAEIQQKNIELAEINASKDKFFSIIAHDLKSPFTGFLGLTRVMAEEIQDLTMKEMQEFAKSMQDSADNLYKLLDNLLEWSRMQRGAMEFKLEKSYMFFIVNQILSTQSEVARQKDIELVNAIPEELQITADIAMINTIMRNFISNAIKFTPKGGKIEIGVSVNEENAYTEIYIKDNGIGMNSDTISNLFRIDAKVSQPGTESEPGTGLGLLLCREFIEKHGGHLRVESEIGKGSTFYFTIPV